MWGEHRLLKMVPINCSAQGCHWPPVYKTIISVKCTEQVMVKTMYISMSGMPKGKKTNNGKHGEFSSDWGAELGHTYSKIYHWLLILRPVTKTGRIWKEVFCVLERLHSEFHLRLGSGEGNWKQEAGKGRSLVSGVPNFPRSLNIFRPFPCTQNRQRYTGMGYRQENEAFHRDRRWSQRKRMYSFMASSTIHSICSQDLC